MQSKYTLEEKKAYYKGLRERWADMKAKASGDNNMKGYFETMVAQGYEFSYNSFCWVAYQLAAQSLEGIPYVDTKTFQGWRASGFKVSKGQKSTLEGITWMEIEGKEGKEDFIYPKVYHLFHRSQVEPM